MQASTAILPQGTELSVGQSVDRLVIPLTKGTMLSRTVEEIDALQMCVVHAGYI
jgi:hypothetical protein